MMTLVSTSEWFNIPYNQCNSGYLGENIFSIKSTTLLLIKHHNLVANISNTNKIKLIESNEVMIRIPSIDKLIRKILVL